MRDTDESTVDSDIINTIDDKELIKELEEWHYAHFRQVPNIGLCCLAPFLYTIAVVVNPTRGSHAHRYCFQHFSEALTALLHWDGISELPGNWMKKKGLGFDDTNPNYVEE